MILFISSTLAIQSCKDDDDDDDYTMDRTVFVTQAASGNMLEIQAGALAMERGSQQVKDYGQMMVTDHTAASAELATLATSKSIPFPTQMLAAHQQQLTQLQGVTGDAFDKAYANLMVQSHQEQVNLFDMAEDEVNDRDLRNFADQKLPTLEAHLRHANELKLAVNP